MRTRRHERARPGARRIDTFLIHRGPRRAGLSADEGGRIVVDGVPRVLLCASLFPFRLPREQWRDRIADVRRLGYDFLDVIIPWNFHETSPGRFDFTGRRDVEHFLRLVEPDAST